MKTEGSAPVAEIQAALADVAQELRRIDARLASLLAALLPGADYQDPTQDWEVPSTLEAELFTALECIHNESLPQLIAQLEKASRLTLEEVKAARRKRKAKKGKVRT